VLRAAAWITALVTLTTGCQRKPSAPAPVASYQVRVSAFIEGRALTQTGQSFARLCAPSPPDITLTPVQAQNGPENLKNVDEGRADIAFIGASLLYEGYRGVVPEFPERFENIERMVAVSASGERKTVELESYWFQKDRIILKLAGCDHVASHGGMSVGMNR